MEEKPADVSEYDFVKVQSNIFLIIKENKAPRIIYDGRTMNRFLKEETFQLPDAALPLKEQFEWCAKVDLKHAFMHFPVSEKFAQYQGVIFNGKIYRYKKLAWGTSFAPFALQSFSSLIVRHLKEKFNKINAYVYMDDFLITGVSREEVNNALNYLL